jgi:DinB superfamily
MKMSNEDRFVSIALNSWKAYIDRADKLFSNLTPDQLNKEVAPGKNRLLYLLGHLTAVHDGMLPLLSLGPRLHPEMDEPFIANPDKAGPNLPSAQDVLQAWTEVNTKLSAGITAFKTEDWLQRHTSVSEQDFAKEPLRNRFAILISRTGHLASHLGQALLVVK